MKDKQRISKIALQVLLDHSKGLSFQFTSVSYGDSNFLHEIFDLSGMKLKNKHPLNKYQAVLNALDRESKRENAIFGKKYFRAYRGIARTFVLKT